MTSYQYGSFGFLNLDQLPGSPLLLLDFGIEKRHHELYDFDNSTRAYEGYLFQYTLKGCGRIVTAGESHDLPEGCGFLSRIPEDSRYFLPMDAPDLIWEYVYCHFTGEAALPFFEKIRSAYGTVLSLSSSDLPISMLLSLHSNMRGGRSLARYEGGEFLYRFLTALLRQLESPELKNGADVIDKAVQLMQERFGSRISIEEVAAAVGLSTAYFTRLFTRQKGDSPLHYLTNLRLQHALTLLLNSRLSIEKIAAECGFSCGNYFCKVFRKACGVSPAEYRLKQYPANNRTI